MKLSPEVRAIIGRFVSKSPVPQGDPGEAFEERTRQWTTAICEQLAFERPQDGFGKKRADPGRPISKDAIARLVDGRLLAWDTLTGAGTGHPALVDDPDSIDITGQVFVPVTARDHLGIVPPPQPVDPPQPVQPLQPIQPLQPPAPGGSPDIAAVLAAIQSLTRSIEELRTATDAGLTDLSDKLSALEQRPAAAPPPMPPVVFPDYIAPLPGGGNIVLKPRH